MTGRVHLKGIGKKVGAEPGSAQAMHSAVGPSLLGTGGVMTHVDLR